MSIEDIENLSKLVDMSHKKFAEMLDHFGKFVQRTESSVQDDKAPNRDVLIDIRSKLADGILGAMEVNQELSAEWVKQQMVALT